MDRRGALVEVRLTHEAAAGDKACEVLGSGARDPHVGAISLGTTATFNTTHRRSTEVIPMVPPYPAALPNTYSLEVQVYRGYRMIEWFKRELGGAEVARAREAGTLDAADAHLPATITDAAAR